MNFDLICKRGTSYLVKKDNIYYFVDPLGETFFSHKDINVFLKWNYFEDIEPDDENYRDVIGKVISNPDAQKPI